MLSRQVKVTNVNAGKKPPSTSKRTTIPVFVWDFLDLKTGDKVDWIIDVGMDGNKQAVIKKHREKS